MCEEPVNTQSLQKPTHTHKQTQTHTHTHTQKIPSSSLHIDMGAYCWPDKSAKTHAHKWLTWIHLAVRVHTNVCDSRIYANLAIRNCFARLHITPPDNECRLFYLWQSSFYHTVTGCGGITEVMPSYMNVIGGGGNHKSHWGLNGDLGSHIKERKRKMRSDRVEIQQDENVRWMNITWHRIRHTKQIDLKNAEKLWCVKTSVKRAHTQKRTHTQS